MGDGRVAVHCVHVSTHFQDQDWPDSDDGFVFELEGYMNPGLSIMATVNSCHLISLAKHGVSEQSSITPSHIREQKSCEGFVLGSRYRIPTCGSPFGRLTLISHMYV